MTTDSNSPRLPLPRKQWLAIFDKDATLFSSWEMAYACYEEAFNKVVSEIYPASEKLGRDEYTREYNPLDRLTIYKKYYPKLTEEQLEKTGEASWQFYLANFGESRFNQIIPGIDVFLKQFKAKNNLIVVLTASDGDESWLRYYNLPFDEMYSLVRLRKMGMIKGGKSEGISFIVDRFSKYCDETVTIGDYPKDHIDGILSIGVGYGLGCPEAREELRKSVDIYAPGVSHLHNIFGI